MEFIPSVVNAASGQIVFSGAIVEPAAVAPRMEARRLALRQAQQCNGCISDLYTDHRAPIELRVGSGAEVL